MSLLLQYGREIIKCATLASSLVFQVRGGDAWEMSVVQAASRHERCGVPTRRAGPRCPRTAGSQSGRTTSRAASECATGTRSSMTGRSAAGTSAGLCSPAAMRSPWSASEGRRGSRHGTSPAFRNPTGFQLKMSSASTLSRSPGRSRRASSRAARTASWPNSHPGPSAPRPVAMGFSIGLGMWWLHRSSGAQLVPTSPSSSCASPAPALLKKACTASTWGHGAPARCPIPGK